jgi:hypothetical protein
LYENVFYQIQCKFHFVKDLFVRYITYSQTIVFYQFMNSLNNMFASSLCHIFNVSTLFFCNINMHHVLWIHFMTYFYDIMRNLKTVFVNPVKNKFFVIFWFYIWLTMVLYTNYYNVASVSHLFICPIYICRAETN